MHTFDQHGDEAEESAKCEKALEGHLCHTVALITENKAVPDGRQMATNVKVEGKSCLPKERRGRDGSSQTGCTRIKEVLISD